MEYSTAEGEEILLEQEKGNIVQNAIVDALGFMIAANEEDVPEWALAQAEKSQACALISIAESLKKIAEELNNQPRYSVTTLTRGKA